MKTNTSYLTASSCASEFEWKVFPYLPHLWEDATSDLERIEIWNLDYPDASWGYRPKASTCVLAVEPGFGGDVKLNYLEARIGSLPETVAVDWLKYTRYQIFELPDKFDSDQLIPKICAGVEVFTQYNGHLPLPGSIHPCIREQYKWASKRSPFEVEIAEIPPVWLERMSMVTA